MSQPQLPNKLVVDASQAKDKISTPASSVSSIEEPAHPGFVGSPGASAASTSTPSGQLEPELNVSTGNKALDSFCCFRLF